MLCEVRSLGLSGISGYEVRAECDLSAGLPAFEIVGLPDAAVKEARDRVRAAIKNCGFTFPVSRITVNLAPANQRKGGTVYDLPILAGILAAGGQLRLDGPDSAYVGELSLSGSLRPVVGMLPMALAARRAGIKRLYVPAPSAAEATLAGGLEVYPVESVGQLAAHLRGEAPLEPAAAWTPGPEDFACPDFADVKGQENVKRALEIAAAGGHNLCMVGPPGSGKSMLARRLPSILPDLTRREALEATEIHSVLGLTTSEHPLLVRRPFRSPHHTVSAMGMAGGGSSPRPGEISLAHNGVLFLDELPEFSKEALETLRQPLEDGRVQISRVSGTAVFPARFMLVCAMNPCKCGWYGYSDRCRCSPQAVEKYLSRLSGPLLDRIDLFVEVPPLDFDALSRRTPAEPSAAIKARVDGARAVQAARFGPGLQRPDGPGGALPLLRPGRRLPRRDEGGLRPDGPHRPQLRPHPPCGPHHRRSGRGEGRRRGAPGRSPPVPPAGVPAAVGPRTRVETGPPLWTTKSKLDIIVKLWERNPDYMNEIILLKLGELVLKGLNRRTFEDRLVANARRRLQAHGKFKVYTKQSTMYVEPQSEDCDLDGAWEAMTKLFGVVGLSRARACAKDKDAMLQTAVEYLGDRLAAAKTFKVESKRADKNFPMTSIQLSQYVGGELDEKYPNLTVDVHHPELTVYLEVRDYAAYVHADPEPGAGGLPVGVGGRAVSLLSGGIDSPVASWMIAKRGIALEMVHFFSYPYTSEEAKQKVLTLAKLLTPWCGRLTVHVVPFTAIQEELRRKCPEELFTVLMRRFMMRIAEAVAQRCGAGAIVTGECLGQVASQTMEAMRATTAVTTLPILRPVVGMDKEEIVRIARRINTFETSILPYEDCCTVFTPRHPRLRPVLGELEAAEAALDVEGLVKAAVDGIERVQV